MPPKLWLQRYKWKSANDICAKEIGFESLNRSKRNSHLSINCFLQFSIKKNLKFKLECRELCGDLFNFIDRLICYAHCAPRLPIEFKQIFMSNLVCFVDHFDKLKFLSLQTLTESFTYKFTVESHSLSLYVCVSLCVYVLISRYNFSSWSWLCIRLANFGFGLFQLSKMKTNNST